MTIQDKVCMDQLSEYTVCYICIARRLYVSYIYVCRSKFAGCVSMLLLEEIFEKNLLSEPASGEIRVYKH